MVGIIAVAVEPEYAWRRLHNAQHLGAGARREVTEEFVALVAGQAAHGVHGSVSASASARVRCVAFACARTRRRQARARLALVAAASAAISAPTSPSMRSSRRSSSSLNSLFLYTTTTMAT